MTNNQLFMWRPKYYEIYLFTQWTFFGVFMLIYIYIYNQFVQEVIALV